MRKISFIKALPLTLTFILMWAVVFFLWMEIDKFLIGIFLNTGLLSILLLNLHVKRKLKKDGNKPL